MSEEDSDSAITDSQTEEEGELPVIQLCGLVEELSYGNSALKTETEMFEKYYSRLEPRDHRMPRLSDIKISAAEFSQLRSRRKSKIRGGMDRLVGLTVEQKLDLVQKELEDTRDEIRHMRANAERDLQHHEAIIEEADIRWNEVQRAVHDFEKDILKTVSKKKGSILATQKVMKYIEDMNRRRDNMKDKLCLKNVSLKVQRKKMLLQLRQVCGSFLSFYKGTLSVLISVSLLGRDAVTTATLIKEDISLGLAYSFRGLVHYHHGGSMAVCRPMCWRRD